MTGFASCPYYQRARDALRGIQALERDTGFTVEVIEHPTRDDFRAWWFAKRAWLGPRAEAHSSSPAVWLHGTDFLGGCDATLAWVRSSFMAGGAISRPPRVTHDNDRDAPAAAAAAAATNGGSDATAVVSASTAEAGAPEGGYKFDVVVIGGGSGGLAFSKEAASLGAKVCVLDFVKPSWAGTTWGLGGTCVNVGCIPKKLMHQAALLGEAMKDAPSFGWEVAAGTPHNWDVMVRSVQDYIASLNWNYRVSLREAGVEYKNTYGTFVDAHTIECTDKKGKKSSITARRVVIATGGRPKALDVPGGELAISSDDLFSLSKAPGKTLVVGASYVALECAGFLAGLGYDVTVMVRSILLRGFDQQMANLIGDYMKEHGVKFLQPAVPTKLERDADGRIAVTWAAGEGAAATGASATGTEVFDTVFVATGRGADTAKLNLAAAGVVAERDGKLRCVGEQTNVPHIYAIGDVLAGRPELTPVAIAAGRLLARRLYGGSSEGMDYEKIPTTVFTPLEYGAVGLAEEDAIARFGDDAVEVYHSNFTPLEWAVVESRPKNACYAKIIVHKADGARIVGFHVLGPNAGEVTQGWGCALRLGATYESFCQTVGIHPTCAEEFTILSVTKRSGETADKGGC